MGTETATNQESTTVRIWTDQKKRVQKLSRKKTDREDREVTECEIVSAAVDAYCAKEEKKLGI